MEPTNRIIRFWTPQSEWNHGYVDARADDSLGEREEPRISIPLRDDEFEAPRSFVESQSRFDDQWLQRHRSRKLAHKDAWISCVDPSLVVLPLFVAVLVAVCTMMLLAYSM
jgi:hypothetical protein